MSDRGSDSDIFITQNTFSKNLDSSCDTDDAEDAAGFLWSLGDRTLDYADSGPGQPGESDVAGKSDVTWLVPLVPMQPPYYSDVSDDDLPDPCTSRPSRFGNPVSDETVVGTSMKRLVD